MKLRTAWKIIMSGSDSNHRQLTKLRAYRRAIPHAPTAEIADWVRFAIKTGARRC